MRLATVLFAGSFHANSYASGVSGISLGAAMLAVAAGVLVLASVRPESGTRLSGQRRGYLAPLVLAAFLAAVTIVKLMIDGSGSTPETAKIALWALSISALARGLGRNGVLERTTIWVGLAGTAFLLAQYAVWFGAHRYLSGLLLSPPLRPYAATYADEAGYENYFGSLFRPASLFAEPAHFANLALAGLCIVLLAPERSRIGSPVHRNAVAAGLSLGLLLSTSTSGVYFGIAIWLAYLWKVYGVRMLAPLGLIVTSVTAGTVLVAWLGVGLPAVLQDTLLYTLNKPQSANTSVRVGGSLTQLSNLSTTEWVFGLGGTGPGGLQAIADGYLNSATSFTLDFGIVGWAAMFVMVVHLWWRASDLASRFILAMYVAKLFGSGLMFNMYGILLLSIAAAGTYPLSQLAPGSPEIPVRLVTADHYSGSPR